MNLAGVDLNLLVVFGALMSERNVTRAGAKVGLSQPATSNALARLRKLLGDQLLVRTSAGLQPTPRAIALYQEIQPALINIGAALTQPPPFQPSTSDRVFTLGMSDYTEFVLLPLLMQKLGFMAPQVKIRVRAVDRHRVLTLLDQDQIDLGIGVFPDLSPWHSSQFLFQENFVCVANGDRDSLTFEDYLTASHLLVSLKEDMTGRVDDFLARQNLKRNIAITVPHFLVVPFILTATNLIATLAERVVNAYASLHNLKTFPLPLNLSGFTVTLLWHQKNNGDPAQIWLRQILTEISEKL